MYTKCKPYFDEKTQDSFHNWITEDLLCPENSVETQYLISLFGVSVMLGLAFGSLFLTNIADVFGRKPVLLQSIFISNIFLLPIILFQSNYSMTLLSTFLFGTLAAVKFSVSYMYSLELTTLENHELFGMTCLFYDGCSSIVLAIYFWFFKQIDTSLWVLILG